MVPPDFSPRQLEIIQLITEGYTGSQIARKLNISENTVNSHCTMIYRLLKKEGIGERKQLIAYAIINNLAGHI